AESRCQVGATRNEGGSPAGGDEAGDTTSAGESGRPRAVVEFLRPVDQASAETRQGFDRLGEQHPIDTLLVGQSNRGAFEAVQPLPKRRRRASMVIVEAAAGFPAAAAEAMGHFLEHI